MNINLKPFLKKHSPTILTCIGAAGVVGTAVLSATATPKALKAIEAKEKEKGEKLTKVEIVRYAAPAYIPAALTCVSTIACIFGANALNKHQQASLMSAYALLDTSYKEYRKRVTDVLGEEASEQISQSIAEDYKENIPEKVEGKQLFFDVTSLKYFYSTLEDVQNAEKSINDIIEKRGYVSFNEYLDALNGEWVDYGYEMGWSTSAGYYKYGYSNVDFRHTVVTLSNGEQCWVIEPMVDPTHDYLYY